MENYYKREWYKNFLFVILFLFPTIVICQNKELTAPIDSIVDKTDVLRKGKTKTYIRVKQKNNKNVKEKWEHFDNKQSAFLSIEYKIDSTVYSEKYYFKKDSLIYAYESALLYFPSSMINDHSTWSGGFYFSNGKLIDHTTLGHGKSEEDDWHPEKEIQVRLKKRKVELTLLK